MRRLELKLDSHMERVVHQYMARLWYYHNKKVNFSSAVQLLFAEAIGAPAQISPQEPRQKDFDIVLEITDCFIDNERNLTNGKRKKR